MPGPAPHNPARPARHLRAEDVMPAPAKRPLWRTILIVVGSIIAAVPVMIIVLLSTDRSR